MNTYTTKEGAVIYYKEMNGYLGIVIPVKNIEDSIQVEISNKVSSSHEMIYKIFDKYEGMDLGDFPPKYSSLEKFPKEIDLTSQKKKLVKIVGWKKLVKIVGWPDSILIINAIGLMDTAIEAIKLWNTTQVGYLAVEYLWASVETHNYDNRIQVMSVVWTDEGIAMKKNLGLFN